MHQPLRVLSIEDNPSDTQLIRDLLEAEGVSCEMTRIDSEAVLLAALERGGIDLILADYTLPSFDGLSALKLATKICPEVPFIFVTGTLGEEVAIEALKIGATDYVLKTRISRLAPSVFRAMREAGERAERLEAGERLRRSEAYLAEAQRLSRTGSFGWNVSTGEIYWSEETFRIFKLDPSTRATVALVLENTHPEDRTALIELLERVARERIPFDFEHRLLLSDGTVKYVHVMGRPSFGHDASSFEFVGAVRDITERKRAEEVLRRSEGYLAEAQRLTHSGSWAWNVRSGELFWSQEAFRIFGYDPETTKPTMAHFYERVHPDDLSAVKARARLEATQKERVDAGSDFRILLPDGRTRHIHSKAHPVTDESGEIVEVVGTAVDVTERKRAEQELLRSERYLAEAQMLTHSGSWAWNVRTGDLFWSKETYRINEFDPEKVKITRDLWLARVHPEDLPSVMKRAELESSTKEMKDSEGDFRIVFPDGRIKHIHSHARPVFNGRGEVVEVIGTAVDVTEQVEARQALERALEEIKVLKDQLYNENIALREEIDRSSMFEEIVGESPALQAVLAHVVKVAPTDSTVLITGETGTGKELIARAIHKRSRRAARAFVSVNCAAIPPSLIASELFGHEKGAFTGAMQRRLGRFELAEGGTIFLDEIGDLPLDVQIALLRVLQEREFERVGGEKVLRANVRVIAATNRDLQASIDAGSFRSDLYYRLNVFPISMPPLRRRREDIPLLVEYFISRFATKAGKKIRGMNKATLERLSAYSWPGNIRELQNVIERSVIVSDSENFAVDESWLSTRLEEANHIDRPAFRLSASQEKAAIETALVEAQGRVSGPDGAAAKLGIPASTLDSKIKALKINKHKFKAV